MTRGYLEQIEAQLVARTEELAAEGRAPTPRRPRRRRDWLAIVPALAAAAAIVIVVLSSASAPARHPTLAGSHAPKVHHSRRHLHGVVKPPGTALTPSEPRGSATIALNSPSPAGGPVPAGFTPQSFTAISEFSWWLLGQAPCASPPCTSIVRTLDGGRSFVGIPAPRTTLVTQVRFANLNDGFAYGPQLWVTHDGGANWHEVDLGGTVTDLEAGGGYVYAIVRFPGDLGRVYRAPVSSGDWSQLTGTGNPTSGLWVYGDDLMFDTGPVSGAVASRQLMVISTDGGVTFNAHPVPPSVTCNFEGMPPVIWAECPTGTESGVWRSTDAGATWPGAGGDATRSGVPSEPNSAAFAAASDTTAVYGYQRLYRTTDGGESWSPIPTPAGIQTWQYLGFTDATHGVAIGSFGLRNRLYYTTDGGASYHLVPIG